MRMAYIGAVLCTSLAIGCGGDDGGTSNAGDYEGDEHDVVSVIDDFANAGNDGDGAEVCEDLFAPALARNVERRSDQGECPAEVEENLKEGEYELDVDDVNVDGTAATVSVTDQDDVRSVMHLAKTGDDWKIVKIVAAE